MFILNVGRDTSRLVFQPVDLRDAEPEPGLTAILA